MATYEMQILFHLRVDERINYGLDLPGIAFSLPCLAVLPIMLACHFDRRLF